MSAMLPSRQLWAQGPHIVAIGGGTGLSTMLRGLKKYTKNRKNNSLNQAACDILVTEL